MNLKFTICQGDLSNFQAMYKGDPSNATYHSRRGDLSMDQEATMLTNRNCTFKFDTYPYTLAKPYQGDLSMSTLELLPKNSKAYVEMSAHTERNTAVACMLHKVTMKNVKSLNMKPKLYVHL